MAYNMSGYLLRESKSKCPRGSPGKYRLKWPGQKLNTSLLHSRCKHPKLGFPPAANICPLDTRCTQRRCLQQSWTSRCLLGNQRRYQLTWPWLHWKMFLHRMMCMRIQVLLPPLPRIFQQHNSGTGFRRLHPDRANTFPLDTVDNSPAP